MFSAADAEGISIHYNCTLRPDLGDLISRPLTWDLTGDAPTVLILHTHATESYTRSAGETYTESAAFRTLDEDYNLISVGDHLTELLEAGGLTVIHDRTLHDYPSYNGSYNSSRKSMASYLKQYPSIQLVLDIHRDASADNNAQMTTTAAVNGVSSSQLMLVVGTNASGLDHPDWEENLAHQSAGPAVQSGSKHRRAAGGGGCRRGYPCRSADGGGGPGPGDPGPAKRGRGAVIRVLIKN